MKPVTPLLNCRHFIVYFTLIALFALHACKVGYSFTGASIPPEAKTVSISYFTNNSSLAPPTLSQQFTEALKDICSSQTRLTLVAKGGDLTFEGYIVDYKVSPLAIQANDQAALNRLTVTVQVKYTNRFDDKKSYEASFSILNNTLRRLNKSIKVKRMPTSS